MKLADKFAHEDAEIQMASMGGLVESSEGVDNISNENIKTPTIPTPSAPQRTPRARDSSIPRISADADEHSLRRFIQGGMGIGFTSS